MHRILSFSLAATLLACSSSGGAPPETTDEDTGTPVDDSSTTLDALDDTGSPSETSVGDSTVTDSTVTDGGGDAVSDDSDAIVDVGSPICSEVGAIETQDCGKCGNKARLCGSDGMWLAFGACTGEKGVCVPGETRMTKCGKCGSRTETCSATCGWTPGACTGEGVCNLGDTETQYGACTAAKEVKIRTCDATCNWSTFGACTAPKGWNDIALAPISGRYYHTAVWTGSEMIVWGGYSSSSSYAADGAAYDPSKDTWRTLEAVPSGFVGREWHTAVWTGTKMIVWGGYNGGTYKNDGAIYDPATKTWTTVPAPSLFTFSGRYYHTAVWSSTTNEMIVWGGYGSSCTGSYCNDGAAFSPSTGMWRQIKASPLSGRYQSRAVFAGGKMIVFGGYGTTCSYYCGDAAAYDPSTDTWTTLTPPSSDLDGRYQHVGIATGTGDSLATFWGGYGNYVSPTYDRNTGATYDPAAGTWKSITPPTDAIVLYSKRYNTTAWWGAGKFWIWGGQSYSGGTLATGLSYDPVADTWTAMPTTNAPTARYLATAVWTGAEAIIWGGYSSLSPYYRQDGKIYRP